MNSKFKGEYSGTKNVSERHTIDQNKLQEFLNDKLDNLILQNTESEDISKKKNLKKNN